MIKSKYKNILKLKSTGLLWSTAVVVASVLFCSLGIYNNPVSADSAGAGPGTGITTGGCSGGWLLGFPHWANGLECDSDGTPKITDLNQLWFIAVNIAEMIIVAAGYAAVGFFIYGGFLYMSSQGDSGKIAAAKNTLLHATVGLIIAIAAVAIINFVVSSL